MTSRCPGCAGMATGRKMPGIEGSPTLDNFRPVAEGKVSVILRGSDLPEEKFFMPLFVTLREDVELTEELKKKIKNIVDEYEKKEQERISKGEPLNYDTYEQHQKFLYSLCWRVFKYRPFEEGGPLYLGEGVKNDPNPEFTQRLTEVLQELGINCPQILGITHAMWWYLFMAAFIIYDIYK